MSSSIQIELPMNKKTGFVDKVKGYLTSETENKDFLDTIKVLQVDLTKDSTPPRKKLRDRLHMTSMPTNELQSHSTV